MSAFTRVLCQIGKGLLLALLLLVSEDLPFLTFLMHEVLLVVQDELNALDGQRSNFLVLLILLL